MNKIVAESEFPVRDPALLTRKKKARGGVAANEPRADRSLSKAAKAKLARKARKVAGFQQ